MSSPLLSGKVFLLVTGASRGIGKQIAESFSSLLGDGSVVLLLARNESGLKKAAGKIPKQIKVHTESVDLSKTTAEQLTGKLDDSLYVKTIFCKMIYCF